MQSPKTGPAAFIRQSDLNNYTKKSKLFQRFQLKDITINIVSIDLPMII